MKIFPFENNLLYGMYICLPVDSVIALFIAKLAILNFV